MSRASSQLGTATEAPRLLLEFYEAFGGKLPKRIAHDGPAGAKLLADRVLGQFAIRAQAPAR